MGVMRILGNLMIAYGPSAAILLQFIAPRSILFILTITSGFFWLISALLASLVWIAIPPLKETHVFHVFVAVFCQALFRYALVKLYMRVESRLPALLPKDSFAQLSDASSSIACGVGFGLAHSLIMYGAIISQAGGVETVLVSDCTNLSIFDISAGSAFLVNVLHLGLMIWAFDAYRKTGWKSYMRWMFLIAVHLTYSLISLAYGTSSCVVAMALQSFLVFAGLILAFWGVLSRHGLASFEQAQRTGIGAHFGQTSSS